MSDEGSRTLWVLLQAVLPLLTGLGLTGFAAVAFRRSRAAAVLVGAAAVIVFAHTGLNVAFSVAWIHRGQAILESDRYEIALLLFDGVSLLGTLFSFLAWGCLFAGALVGRRAPPS